VCLQLHGQRVASAAEIQQHGAVLCLLRDLGGEAGREFEAIAGPQSPSRPGERPPTARRRLLDQRRFDRDGVAPTV
jgi:hypothetical protein